jgi:hypothetical protein
MWRISSTHGRQNQSSSSHSLDGKTVADVGEELLADARKTRLHVPLILSRIQQLQNQMDTIPDKIYNRNQRCMLRQHIEKLQVSINALESKETEEKLQEQVQMFQDAEQDAREVAKMEALAKQTGQDGLPNKHSIKALLDESAKKAEQQVMDEFMTQCAMTKPAACASDNAECEDCGGTLLFDTSLWSVLCETCGTTSAFVDAVTSAKAFGEDVDLQIFCYRRVGHCRERLTLIQAKESTRVPHNVLVQVGETLIASGHTDVRKVSMVHIRKALKTLKLKHYYRNTMQILCGVTGRAPPRLTKTQEKTFLDLFMQMQEPFERLKTNRSNFLSYSSVMRRLCELQGLHEFKQYFPLLRGSEKVAHQNQLFKSIARALNWPLDRFDFRQTKNCK